MNNFYEARSGANRARTIGRSLPLILMVIAPLLGGELYAQDVVTYGGLSNSPVGNAHISLDGTNLVVSGISDAGNEGLSVDLHRSGGLMLDLPGPSGPDGSSMVSTSYHNDDNVTTSVTTSVAGGTVSVRADFSHVGAKSQIVEVYSAGQRVASMTHDGSRADVQFSTTWQPASYYCICTGGDQRDNTAVYIYGGHAAAGATAVEQTTFTLPDGSQATGDEFRMRPADETTVISYTSRGDVTATGMPGFTINAEYVEILGQFHTGLGAATLDANDPLLHVDNIGASGDDGVQIQLENSAGFDSHTDPIDFSAAGAQLAMRAVGDFSGTPNSDLGGATIKNNGSDLALQTFYDGVNAKNVKIEFVNGTEVVGTTVVPAGDVGMVLGTQARVIGCGKVPPRPPVGTSCIWFELDAQWPVRASDGTQFNANVVRLLADDATGPINSLSNYTIKGANIGSLTINNEFLYQHSTTLGVADEPAATFTFSGAVPNITHGATTIGYTLDRDNTVRLELLNTQGKLIETIEQGSRTAGAHSLPYDASKLASGAYFLRLTCGSWATTSRLVVVR